MTNRTLTIAARATPLLLFASLLLFWGLLYPNHLEQKEQMQLFLFGPDYLSQHLSFQGGFAKYISEFITQFFLFPWVGALLVSTISTIAYLLASHILKKTANEKVNFLALIPVLGYTFLLCNDFYYLSGLMSITLSLALACIYVQIENPTTRTVAGLFLIPLIYWLLGGSFILFTTSVVTFELIRKTDKHQIIKSFAYIITAIAVLVLAHRFLIVDTKLQTIASPVFYKFTLIVPNYIWAMLVSVPVLALLATMIKKWVNERMRAWIQLTLLLVIASASAYGFYTIPNYNEELEMRYDNLVTAKQWHQIVNLAETNPPTGPQGKLAAILALGQTNQLGDKLFQTFQPTKTDLFIPYEMHGMAPMITNEPYYYLGFNNFAQMLAMETIESTPDAATPVRSMKRYAETCIINGQYDVAARFLRKLQQTLFYSKWATNAMDKLGNEAAINADAEWGKLRERMPNEPFYFQYDNLNMMLVYLLRHNIHNQLAFDYLTTNALINKDFDNFLATLPLLKKMGRTELPTAYQEALAYVKTLTDQLPAEVSEFKIDDAVTQNLNAYAQTFRNGGSNNPSAMQKLYGHTYWYYVHFCGEDDEKK